MKLHRLPIFSMLLLSAIVLTSCGGGSGTESADQAAASEEFDEAKSQVISDINQVLKDLPPPSEVPYLLMATGSDYDASLVNGLENLESYTSPINKAALNLGIYITDIGYLTSYEKAQETLNYVSACQRLAEAVGVASAMDMELMGRFERNLTSKDSLRVLVNEIMSRTGERLDAMDRISVAGLSLAGSYIEGLYVSTTLIQTYPDDLDEDTRNLILEPLIKIVIDQKPALDDLISVMEGLGEEETVATVLVDLKKIKGIYEAELAEVTQQITDNTGGLMLTTDVLNNLTAETTRIRNSYTN